MWILFSCFSDCNIRYNTAPSHLWKKNIYIHTMGPWGVPVTLEPWAANLRGALLHHSGKRGRVAMCKSQRGARYSVWERPHSWAGRGLHTEVPFKPAGAQFSPNRCRVEAEHRLSARVRGKSGQGLTSGAPCRSDTRRGGLGCSTLAHYESVELPGLSSTFTIIFKLTSGWPSCVFLPYCLPLNGDRLAVLMNNEMVLIRLSCSVQQQHSCVQQLYVGGKKTPNEHCEKTTLFP